MEPTCFGQVLGLMFYIRVECRFLAVWDLGWAWIKLDNTDGQSGSAQTTDMARSCHLTSL